MGSGFVQGVEPLPCPFLTAFYGPGPIVGPGFSPPFWGWRKRRGACRGGGGAKRPHRKGGGLWPPPLRRFCGPWARKTPPPRRGRPTFLRPQATPILPMDAGWGWGRRAPWGTRRGGGVWRPGAARRAAPGLPNKRARPGPLAPGALFQGASRPAAAPPPGRWDFAPPPRRGRQGGKPGRSAGLGMADVGPGLSEWLGFCQAVFLWQKEQHPDFLGNKAQIYKL